MSAIPTIRSNGTINRLAEEDKAVHGWYRFVLGYPAHLVDEYLEKFGANPTKHIVFDPFCGTGTTPVEAKKAGFQTVATDANPIALFATRVKTKWDVSARTLAAANSRIIEEFEEALDANNLNTERPPLFGDNGPKKHHGEVDPGAVKNQLPDDLARVMPYGFISPVPFAKIDLLQRLVGSVKDPAIRDMYRLAIAAILVESVGNVGFGPEVYMTKPKPDAPVMSVFQKKIGTMLEDLRAVQAKGLDKVPSSAELDDARVLGTVGSPKIDFVITSPPYPNEKDYTRSTRLESVILGFINNIHDLREVKNRLLKSNTRTIFKGDDDSQYIAQFASIQQLAKQIEDKRIELKKTSGFEKLYHRVVTLYFGGMYRHLETLKPKLNRGARLAYVVGDQMSFFRIHIKTGELLAEIAESLGYVVDGIDLWRERLSTTTRLMLREEVVLLRKK